jgi:hypothetical protein
MSRKTTRLTILSILLALSPAMAWAQGRRGGGGRGGVGRGAVGTDERSVLLLLTALLSLSDAQQKQVGMIFDSAEMTAAPIAMQIKSSEAALFQAANSGKDDQVKSLSDQIGSLTSQMRALQAQTLSRVVAILTADQKPKVDDFIYDDIGKFLADAMPTPPAAPGVPKAADSQP